MSVVNLPTLTRIAPTTVSFGLIHNTQVFESPLDGSVQTLEIPGARWHSVVEWPYLTESDARILKAFLAGLRGMAGRFYLGDLSHDEPFGTAQGTPLVKGAGQYGRSLLTDGWTANQSGLLLPGDYFSVNGELKIVTAVAASNGSGEATIQFSPHLRISPPDNAPLVITSPVCTMRLKDDQQDQMIIDPERRPTVRIECVEVFS